MSEIRRTCIALLLLCVCTAFGCTTLGSLSKPSEYDMYVSSRSINVSSADEAFRDIQIVFKGIKYTGKYIFDECSTDAIRKEAIDVTCIMYDEDRTYRYIEKDPSFRLRTEGSYSLTVALCPSKFKAIRQFPLFLTHYFFVNGFCFEGDKERALRAYNLLKYICEN